MNKKFLLATVLALFSINLWSQESLPQDQFSASLQNQDEPYWDTGFRITGLAFPQEGFILKTDAFLEYSAATGPVNRIGLGTQISWVGGIGIVNTGKNFFGAELYSIYQKNNFQLKAGGFISSGFFEAGKIDYGTVLRINRNFLWGKTQSFRYGLNFGLDSYLPLSAIFRDFITDRLFPSEAAEDSSPVPPPYEEDCIIEPDPIVGSLIVGLVPKIYLGMTFRF